jgi:hypothetical protein
VPLHPLSLFGRSDRCTGSYRLFALAVMAVPNSVAKKWGISTGFGWLTRGFCYIYKNQVAEIL